MIALPEPLPDVPKKMLAIRLLALPEKIVRAAVIPNSAPINELLKIGIMLLKARKGASSAGAISKKKDKSISGIALPIIPVL